MMQQKLEYLHSSLIATLGFGVTGTLAIILGT
jgi:hypothetical protein